MASAASAASGMVGIDYCSAVNQASTDKKKAHIAFLRSIKLFENVTDKDLKRIAKLVDEVITIQPPQNLFEQGTEADSICIIRKGAAHVFVDGVKVTQDPLGPGTSVGELTFFSQKKRFATVTTIEDSTFLKFNKKKFQEFLGNNKDVLLGILKHLFARLYVLNRDHPGITSSYESSDNQAPVAAQLAASFSYDSIPRNHSTHASSSSDSSPHLSHRAAATNYLFAATGSSDSLKSASAFSLKTDSTDSALDQSPRSLRNGSIDNLEPAKRSTHDTVQTIYTKVLQLPNRQKCPDLERAFRNLFRCKPLDLDLACAVKLLYASNFLEGLSSDYYNILYTYASNYLTNGKETEFFRIYQKAVIKNALICNSINGTVDEYLHITTILTSCSLFKSIPFMDLLRISFVIQRLNFSPGESIFSIGAKGDGLFVIERGLVSIQINKPIAEKSDGEFFGEMALFEKDGLRCASAVAATSLTVYKIPTSKFLALIDEYPSILRSIYIEIAERIKIYNDAKIAAKKSQTIRTPRASDRDVIVRVQTPDDDVFPVIGLFQLLSLNDSVENTTQNGQGLRALQKNITKELQKRKHAAHLPTLTQITAKQHKWAEPKDAQRQLKNMSLNQVIRTITPGSGLFLMQRMTINGRVFFENDNPFCKEQVEFFKQFVYTICQAGIDKSVTMDFLQSLTTCSAAALAADSNTEAENSITKPEIVSLLQGIPKNALSISRLCSYGAFAPAAEMIQELYPSLNDEKPYVTRCKGSAICDIVITSSDSFSVTQTKTYHVFDFKEYQTENMLAKSQAVITFQWTLQPSNDSCYGVLQITDVVCPSETGKRSYENILAKILSSNK